MEQVGEYRNIVALRFLIALQSRNIPSWQFESTVRTFYRAFFTEGSEIDFRNAAQILQFALTSGLSESLARDCLELSQSESTNRSLEENIQQALQLGAFGVPSTVVYSSGEHSQPELFWGSDRNEFVAPLLIDNNSSSCAY